MPCLFALLALLAPRLVLFLLWFFTTWLTGVVSRPLWLILGFIFLPTTLLWYSVVQHWSYLGAAPGMHNEGILFFGQGSANLGVVLN